jgi:hypothetical protein
MCTLAMQQAMGTVSPPTTPPGAPQPPAGALSDPKAGLDIYDYSSRYNRALTPQDEQRFQEWATTNNRQNDAYDYDIRGFWKDNGQFSGNGHGSDLYKKPNHPTFSDQSIYHGADGAEGGTWGDGTFTPSDHNLQMFSPGGLKRYFDQREPGYRLVLPDKPKTQE